MPIPFVDECLTALQGVSTAKTTVLEAIGKIKEYATDETWKGTDADSWMADLSTLATAAATSLGQPLTDVRSDCLDYAQKLQNESASPGPP